MNSMMDDSNTFQTEEEETNVVEFSGRWQGEYPPTPLLGAHYEELKNDTIQWFVGISLGKDGEFQVLNSSPDLYKVLIAAEVAKSYALEAIKAEEEQKASYMFNEDEDDDEDS